MKRSYSIQENGQVTLPAEWRERYGLKKGDVIEFVETDQGLLVRPRAVIAVEALDRIAEVLRAQGVSLEELLEGVNEDRTRRVSGDA